MKTSEALHWTQQQKIDPEQQLYTPKIENIAVIEITAALHTQDREHCCDRDVRRHQRLFIRHNNNMQYFCLKMKFGREDIYPYKKNGHVSHPPHFALDKGHYAETRVN
ncbi:hypothetical protein LAZ67_3003559, partial [Cordylochernes scorpioides]